MSSRKRSPRVIGLRRRRTYLANSTLENLESRLLLSQGTLIPEGFIGPVAPSAPASAPAAAPAAKTTGPAVGTPKLPAAPTTAWHAIQPIQLLGSPQATPNNSMGGPDQGSGTGGYTPLQLQTAYGLNTLLWGTVQANGAGQTIAVIDVGDNPGFVDSSSPNFVGSALNVFDTKYNLPDPTFTKYNQNGQTTNLPQPNKFWTTEIALDVEWAHSMAPMAKIDLVEATNSTTGPGPLMQAAYTAVTKLGASVVSMSFGYPLEYEGQGIVEQDMNSTFIEAALAVNPNVTFLASTGDHGELNGNAPNFPSTSPDVVAVGGTTLKLNSSNQWLSETGWSYGSDSYCPSCASGGGISSVFTEPTFQDDVQSSGNREVPDVSSDADPSTGVWVYDPYTNGTATPWGVVGGTSLSSPSWAGFIADADQGRQALYGNGPLDGPQETLPALYGVYGLGDAYSTYFHDITVGNNGFNAGPGYDLVTGIGSPRTQNLLPVLAAYGIASQAAVSVEPPSSVVQGGHFGTIVEAEDSAGALDIGFDGTATISLVPGTGPAGAPAFTPVTADFEGGVAVIDGLQLSTIGSGYQFEIAISSLPTVKTTTVSVMPNTSGNPTYYPVPVDSSIRNDLSLADGNSSSISDIYLVYDPTVGIYTVTQGELHISNTSLLTQKNIFIIGDDETDPTGVPVISAEGDQSRRGHHRYERRRGKHQRDDSRRRDLEGGVGRDAGGLTLPTGTGVGGGLLIEGGNVSLSHVNMRSNEAVGVTGARGSSGASIVAAPGGVGGTGKTGKGGAIYLASGSLTLKDDVIERQ